MKLKPLVLSVILLAVLSGIAFWANRPSPAAAADPRAGQPLADPAAIAQAAQVRLTDDGKTVLLTRQPDGTWRVPGYFGMTADFSKLSSFVSDLTAAKIQRLVTVNPDRISRLEFKDTKIELLAADGHVLWSVLLGKSADAGGRFVRFGDESKAYLATLNSTIETDPKAWADTTLFTLQPDDVAQIEVPFENGSLVLFSRKTKDAPWTSTPAPAGQKVSADKISALLTSLGGLHFSDSSDPADPQVKVAQAHERTFKLTTFAGTTFHIALGRKPEEKKPKPPADAAVKTEPKAAADAATTPPPEPAADTIPAGPVYAFIVGSDAQAPVNALMRQRAFQIDEYVFSSLPQKAEELFEPAAAPAATPAAGK
jgi:Domain of unknown function (DUF4340)